MKGYKRARFRAFDTKREAQDWLKSECNNNTDEAIESAARGRPGLGLAKTENTAKWIVSLMVRMRRKVI